MSTAQLARNQACSSCRTRKLRCDGGRPCHHCRRLNRQEDCEYVEQGGSSTAQKLEEQIKAMEDRLTKLQLRRNVGYDHKPVYLRDPYANDSAGQQVIIPKTPSKHDQAARDSMIEAVLSHAVQLCFYMSTDDFRRLYTEKRVVPHLLLTMYLCGSLILEYPPAVQQRLLEEVKDSRDHLHKTSNVDPTLIQVQRVQGEILLVQYLTATNKLQDAYYHCTSAIGAGVTIGLPKMGTLNPYNIRLDERQWRDRVLCFWGLLACDHQLAVIRKELSNFQIETLVSEDLTTPWPGAKRDTLFVTEPKTKDANFVYAFLNLASEVDAVKNDSLWPDLYIKSVLLCYWANHLQLTPWRISSTARERVIIINQVKNIERYSRHIISILPPLTSADLSRATEKTIQDISTLLHSSLLLLYQPVLTVPENLQLLGSKKAAQEICLTVSVAIFDIAASIREDEFFAPSWMSKTWVDAAEVLPLCVDKDHKPRDFDKVRRGLKRMTGFRNCYPLMDVHLSKIKDVLAPWLGDVSSEASRTDSSVSKGSVSTESEVASTSPSGPEQVH